MRILTKLASKEAEQGLSKDEIAALTFEEINGILSAENQSAKDALAYFGFTQ